MFRRITLALLALTLCCGQALAADKYIVASDCTWPPMEMLSADKKPEGFSTDYIRAAAKAAEQRAHEAQARDARDEPLLFRRARSPGLSRAVLVLGLLGPCVVVRRVVARRGAARIVAGVEVCVLVAALGFGPGSSAAPHCGHTRPCAEPVPFAAVSACAEVFSVPSACAEVVSVPACAEVVSASGCSLSGKLEASFMFFCLPAVLFLKCLYRSRYL